MADKAKDKKRADASETSGPLPTMSTPPAEKAGHHKKFDRETYEVELEKLQVELPTGIRGEKDVEVREAEDISETVTGVAGAEDVMRDDEHLRLIQVRARDQ